MANRHPVAMVFPLCLRRRRGLDLRPLPRPRPRPHVRPSLHGVEQLHRVVDMPQGVVRWTAEDHNGAGDRALVEGHTRRHRP